ncbi:uncharacterized protein [Aegilops tauschii subsp. strangulata]|uniref:Protein kinase domain-containing protein n=2 Tax=Aegilops tauschii subsp. strangulata TaxID=200361 RepID=A0A453GF58_AEGTS|nr:uncharacterized protein LOC109764072 isoform X1 [Aegilops tauschii subsp. strangulata]
MDRQASARIDLECMLLDETKEPRALPLPLLEEITKSFSADHEIGRGGFAVVYQGILDNGMVAVKKLSNTYLYENKFQTEIQCLMKVKHRNVVRFLGYCCDTQGQVATHEGNFVMADIQERLLCFEFLSKGDLSNYISDASSGLEWRDRYKIIKGICEGLNYLHRNGIVHLDLKPANILMDAKMVPKIGDFGLSRCFQEEQTRTIATTFAGSLGYLAPEFSDRIVTPKYDLYSLGVIITEILTGEKGYSDVEEVLESWSNRLEKSQRQQVRVCTEIALQCTERNPKRRPTSTQYVIDRLTETESAGTMELLDVYLVELRFPVEPNTDEHTLFRLMKKSTKPWRCFASLPLYGIVPPKSSTYTLVVTAQQQERLPEETDYDLILQSSLSGDKSNPTLRDQSKYDKFFDEAKDSGNAVHEVMLKTVFASQGPTTSEPTISRRLKDQWIISLKNTHGMLCSLDAQPTEPCIVTSHQHGDVCIWNYDPQRRTDSFNVSKESIMPSYSLSNKVHSVKVISRKKWFVAGTSDGVIHVYNYDNKIQKLRSFRAASDCFITSMAIHPTRPYVLSSAHRGMKLWDWDNDWECTQSFVQEHSDTIQQVAFNPVDSNMFASTSDDHTVKVWSIDSPESKYTLSGHQDKVNCLNFFTCNDRQYLITGSDDHTAKIWDMEEKACVHTMQAFVSPVISVMAFPDSSYLITGSSDGSVHFWSSSEFSDICMVPRLERIVNFGSGGAIWGLGCFMGSRRIVIGQEYAVSIMAIDNEEESNEKSI